MLLQTRSHPLSAVLRVFHGLALITLMSGPVFARESHPDQLRAEIEPDLEHESQSALGAAIDRDYFDPRLPVPVIGTVEMRAGDRVSVRWQPIEPTIKEFELILSLDGGRSWSLRISPELDPGKDRYVWEVPNLVADEARMRIRARFGGREVWGPEGRAFRMLPDPDRPREGWLFWEIPRWDQGTMGGDVEAGFTGPAGGTSLHAGEPSVPVEPTVRILAPSTTLHRQPLPTVDAYQSGAAATRLTTLRERLRPMRE